MPAAGSYILGIRCRVLYLQKIKVMQTAKKSTGLYWILFLISVAAFFWVYSVAGGYCSLVLPFNVTFFAKALDLL
jgi:hypothetical protein